MVLILLTQWSHTGHPQPVLWSLTLCHCSPWGGGWLAETQGLALHIPRIPLVCSHLPLPMTVSDILHSSLLLSTSLSETFHTLHLGYSRGKQERLSPCVSCSMKDLNQFPLLTRSHTWFPRMFGFLSTNPSPVLSWWPSLRERYWKILRSWDSHTQRKTLKWLVLYKGS